ncbi:MAG: xanthine dehydrogenase molybdenum-binding subunit XdhA [Firmicutes bacterium HGW-Firmicutes-16]|nr:MAG: xanthine dehydrogenase molybdenum-binding subunit XdhA [Firmicutes bacterium HGW-Firmicutes-16]
MGVQKSVSRLDAVQKVTGTAKYVEDLILLDALHVKVVHSTIANGTVKGIDCSEALKMPGVVTVLTCFDVPEHLYATAGHPLSLDPNHADIKDKTILSARVRYYGDDIAAVVADTPLRAQLAAETIKVEYEELAPMLTPEVALGGDALHEACPDNELARMDFEISPEGNVSFERKRFSSDAVIAGRDDLKGEQYHVPPVNACHIENNCCFAYMEGRRMVVYSCNQVPHTLRRNVAEAIGMPLGDVRVIKPFMGGGFGNKQDTMYEPLVAFLSRKLGGRCVALVLTREETFVNTRTRHGMDLTTVTVADERGKITKKALRINSNGGAYAAHGHAVAAYAITNCFQTYIASELQLGESSTAYTNLPPAAAMRGYGIPQLAFAMESQMDDVALAHGWDPIEFRKWNMHRDGFCDPFDKFIVRSYGLESCIDKGRELSHWDDKRREYDEFNRSSKDIKKGIGMALFSYKTGVYPIQIENAACRIVMNEDGTAQIQVGATELGQGSDTVLCQIVSEFTTIPENRLTLVSAQDTDIAPYDNGAYASRQTYISGNAAKKTAMILRSKLLEKASLMTGVPADELTLKNEHATVESTGRELCSIADICSYFNFVNDLKTDTEHITAEATFTAKDICFSYGVSYIDLEVDVPLGKVKLKKVYSVHDSGTILNPQLAAGQLHGGIVMGLGYALGEQMLFDQKTGKPLNNNLLDYKLPTAMDVPEIETHFVETYEPSGPFGSKGLAEPPLIPQAPAIRNAILHATGVPIYKLPMNPQNLVHEFIRANLIKS